MRSGTIGNPKVSRVIEIRNLKWEPKGEEESDKRIQYLNYRIQTM